MTRPLVPRDWKTTDAVVKAKKSFTAPSVRGKGGKSIPAFNGSQTSRRNKKRPVTLPGAGKCHD